MCLNLTSLEHNFDYWHTVNELPIPHKQIFVKNKIQHTNRYIPYVSGFRLAEMKNTLEGDSITLFQAYWIDTDQNYCATYFNWYQIVDKWIYMEDLEKIIE